MPCPRRRRSMRATSAMARVRSSSSASGRPTSCSLSVRGWAKPPLTALRWSPRPPRPVADPRPSRSERAQPGLSRGPRDLRRYGRVRRKRRAVGRKRGHPASTPARKRTTNGSSGPPRRTTTIRWTSPPAWPSLAANCRPTPSSATARAISPAGGTATGITPAIRPSWRPQPGRWATAFPPP